MTRKGTLLQPSRMSFIKPLLKEIFLSNFYSAVEAADVLTIGFQPLDGMIRKEVKFLGRSIYVGSKSSVPMGL
jgi:hypothetical protein